VALWPDNVEAWNHWICLQTQWRFAGEQGIPTGLDYAAVCTWLRATVRTLKARQRLLLDLRECEDACLNVWNSDRQLRTSLHGARP